jgi:hypothetical protein
MESSKAVAGSVSDCTVAGQSAAAFGFSIGTKSGYRLFVVHNDLLFETIMFGASGLSDQAIRDAIAMIASLSWTF